MEQYCLFIIHHAGMVPTHLSSEVQCLCTGLLVLAERIELSAFTTVRLRITIVSTDHAIKTTAMKTNSILL